MDLKKNIKQTQSVQQCNQPTLNNNEHSLFVSPAQRTKGEKIHFPESFAILAQAQQEFMRRNTTMVWKYFRFSISARFSFSLNAMCLQYIEFIKNVFTETLAFHGKAL